MDGNVIVDAARSWIGTPYRHQASRKSFGTDCLGLIRGVWREVLGVEPEVVPSYTADWSEASGEERLWTAAERHLVRCGAAEEIRPGDVLLFRMRDKCVAKHLGIASRRPGGESFIHAYSGHGVTENYLTRDWRRRVVAHFAFPQVAAGGDR